MKSTTNQRILAVDILRGITIAGMIMVNNPGAWSKVYAPLGHAAWNGLTPTDLVFPFFMTIMGISMFIALRKFNFEASAKDFKKNNFTLFSWIGNSLVFFDLSEFQ